MKALKYILILLISLLITAFKWGSPAGEYGDKFEVKDIIPIREIMASPEKYMGKKVVVEGELFDVCQDMGCWFSIKDKTGAIYVDLQMGIKFTLPKNSNGYRALVLGEVTNEGGKTSLKLKGKGVKILKK
ncbi:MAG: DUF4920 domain-containing protein [Nitrospinae bacterium]|nr:DUF4920 domain-containing protein [Nitrospinota bacterium]